MLCRRTFKNRPFRYTMLVFSGIFAGWFLFFALPRQPFDVPYSSVLYSGDGYLLNARVARDHQWRFPSGGPLSPKFERCILTFEDRGFYYHPGISPKGIGRALVQNVGHGRVISGGSTISMQTIRLMRHNPPRSFREKLYEMVLALRLEMRYSKKEILQLYAGHAPFGNNVVGIDAASWRYFGKRPGDLSWGQNALLAVLPNAPGLLYPGRNHDRLLAKRNRLLARLQQEGIIDAATMQLAMAEPIPDKPLPLPDKAWHYFVRKNHSDTLSHRMQEQCRQLAASYAQRYRDNQVQNIAIIVRDVRSGQILAYVGNTAKEYCPATSFVDCAAAPRSTGSVLKPLLYYKSLSAGLITPEAMLPDIPVSFNHFTPQNYARSYEGLVSARKALTRSLNIPMVTLLNSYGLQKFHAYLRQSGFRHMNRSAADYGLSLILGSGEITLDELSSVYTRWAGSLYRKGGSEDKAGIYETLEAMSELNRPDENGNWKVFMNTQKIAWKTGTSFGNRDAWCIGISSAYVVAVWVGNADGSGRPGLTGIDYAAPLLFDIFNVLPKHYTWFPRPETGYAKVELCKASGYKAGPACDETEVSRLPSGCAGTGICPYHHMLAVNEEETFRVNADVYDWQKIKQKSYFLLPPTAAAYFKSWNPGFRTPPPWHPAIRNAAHDLSITFPDRSTILLFDGKTQMDINFRAMAQPQDATLFWHVDGNYIGQTSHVHELQYTLPPGRHLLKILDEYGNERQTDFEILPAKS